MQMQDRVGQQFGNYRLIRLIGKGGYAEVYLAEHLYLKNRKYAIKILTGTNVQDYQREEFLTEARTIASLQHLSSHIVQIHDFGIQLSASGIDSGIPYFVMEYALEGTLRKLYPHREQVSLERIVFYVNQIAEALQCAHDQSPPVVHSDVKPENMLLRSSDHVLLSDFGIAVTGNTGTVVMPSGKREVIGTLTYLAPERFRGHTRRASDQYSLGIVVYEWLCGNPPFDDMDGGIIKKQLYEEPPPLCPTYSRVTEEIEKVVMRALKKEPEERYPTVQAFAQALEGAIHSAKQQTWQLSGNRGWPQAIRPANHQQGQGYQAIDSTTVPFAPQQPLPPRILATQPIRQPFQGMREFFDFSPRFARDQRYSFFRTLGVFLNIFSAVIIGLLLRNILILLGGLVFSYLLFALCVRAVEEKLAMFFGTLVALYWGGVGWVIGSFVVAYLRLTTSFPSVFLGFVFFSISFVLHVRYITRKNL